MMTITHYIPISTPQKDEHVRTIRDGTRYVLPHERKFSSPEDLRERMKRASTMFSLRLQGDVSLWPDFLIKKGSKRVRQETRSFLLLPCLFFHTRLKMSCLPLESDFPWAIYKRCVSSWSQSIENCRTNGREQKENHRVVRNSINT